MAGLTSTGVGDTGIYLLGATSNDGMKFKGSYLLQWRMMQWLKECGCAWYDLGGINPDRNPGVYHFKQGFGGVDSVQCPRLRYSSDWLSTLAVTGSERARESVKKLKALLRPSPKPESPAATAPSRNDGDVPAKDSTPTPPKKTTSTGGLPPQRSEVVPKAEAPVAGKAPAN
jgi:hypothetical protein